MARSRSRSRSTSTLKTMRATSAVLVLAVAGLVAEGVNQIRHYDVLTGTKIMLWAFVPLAILLGFTLPVMCKVKRTNGQACGNWAYGLLFGCTKAARHWTEKFRVRLRFPPKEVRPVERRQATGSYALSYQPSRRSQQQIKVTVDGGTLGICGFWVSVVSMIAAVIPVIALFVH